MYNYSEFKKDDRRGIIRMRASLLALQELFKAGVPSPW